MAFYDLTNTATTGRLSRMVTTLNSAFWAWRDGRANRDALGKLTDRELSDIGLMRGNFDHMSGDTLRNS